MSFMGGSTTVCALPSLLQIRSEVRVVRRAREWTLDKLRDESGVDRAAIHKIENTAKYPDYEPGVDTVRKLVEAMGLTLSDFFLRIEGLRPTEGSDQQSATPTSKADPNARTLSEAERSADAVVQRALIVGIAEEIARAIDRLIESRATDRPFEKAEAAARRSVGADR